MQSVGEEKRDRCSMPALSLSGFLTTTVLSPNRASVLQTISLLLQIRVLNAMHAQLVWPTRLKLVAAAACVHDLTEYPFVLDFHVNV